ncbi:high mobility group B protein 13-like isoform X1 [Coffea eugenioides]|uniref:high mobility group B protein 13-like isoform X1 n=1 Tax=Coffea eugenioides TaxID=49369 RepID=UPI000F60FA86|nr:high mobility group B protein 13-like isoform X1 [Coffea eugenioides]
MAAIAEMPLVSEPAPTKKGRSRRALKQKTPSSSEANIVAGTVPQPSPVAPPSENCPTKENHKSLSSQLSPQKKSKRGASKASKQQPELSFEKELLEMQERFEKLRLEKQQTEELLKVKEEALKQNEEEKEKLHVELKKLQKVKEFKPTMTLPMLQALKDNDQEKKGKKKADPATKRPSPPYALWCKDQWNEVKKANPEADFKEISTLLGAKWKTLSTEEKKPYEERYQEEKEAYLKIVGIEKREHEAMKLLEEEQKQKTAMELLEQYMQFKQEAEKENKKTNKQEKDPLKPKQPLTAFFLYSNERRATLLAENKNVLEVAKVLGEEWKNMTEKQRAPYEKIANKNKEQYLLEIELYKQRKEEEAAYLKKEEEELMKLQKQEALQLLKKKEKAENIIKKTKEKRQKKKEEKDVDPNKPKKPASSFLLFSKEARKTLSEERPGINNSTLNALISVKWKELSEEEKQVWNEKAAKAMEAYKKEVEEYNKKLVAENQKN